MVRIIPQVLNPDKLPLVDALLESLEYPLRNNLNGFLG